MARTKGGNGRSKEIGETWAGPTTMASRALGDEEMR